MRELTVDLGDRSYPIYIGEGLLSEAGSRSTMRGISRKSPLLIVTDENVGPLFLRAAPELFWRELGFPFHSFTVPPGEASKSLDMFQAIITEALNAGLYRKSAIVALGGGVVGDLAGDAGSLYERDSFRTGSDDDIGP